MPRGGGPEGDRGCWPALTPSMGALEQHPWESNGCPGHLLLPSAGMLHGEQTGDQENPRHVHLRGKNKPHSCFHPPFPKESHSTPCEKKRFPLSPAHGDCRLSTGWIGAAFLLPSFLLLKLSASAFQDTACRCPFVLNHPPANKQSPTAAHIMDPCAAGR